jgi:ferrous iron transport protein A
MSQLDAAISTTSLDHCQRGIDYRIQAIGAQPLFGANDDHVTQRLKELGFLPGVTVKVIGFGFLGRDPLAIQINDTKFALRRAEAAKVLVSATA